MSKLSPPVKRKVVKRKAWVHISLMTGKVFDIYLIKNKPVAIHETESFIPCTITYSVPLTKRKK